MNFTREPIIETVITPRDGCTLVVRSSKGNVQEEYSVEAVEVVSFGNSHFYRSQERVKSFLVPVSDYEVLELKEARMVLKNVATDRSIKIGGGRETPPPSRPREEQQQPQDSALVESRPAPVQEQRPPGKRDNKRRRGRRGRDRHDPSQEQYPKADQYSNQPRDQQESRGEQRERPSEDLLPNDGPESSSAPEEPKAPSFISKLFPPPPTLIRENLSRYKTAETEDVSIKEKSIIEETIFEHPELSDGDAEDDNEE